MMPGLAAGLGRTEGASKDPCWPHARDEALHDSGSGLGWLHVYMCPEDMEPGLAWLAARHEVSWVKPLSRQEPHNAVAGWIIQSDASDVWSMPNSTSDRYGVPYHQIRLAGIRSTPLCLSSAGDVADNALYLRACDTAAPKQHFAILTATHATQAILILVRGVQGDFEEPNNS
ncbi:hypothetical protein HYH03_013643 [Edaphochlamys debaryana]|uniref:Ricin B lectin domain-containing protein n=1 Tax=Edaphochlamys debaryana TaxID=47281 RepID=A0A835XQE8_9CHLO|nr:hypothetical protein HYH03_013643 [Edaphochlamys debaryana]|eukprot:KAG2487799.1 hypothetical protein HYH03_013643 [Edaphochlamys debaryana]